MYVIAGTFAAHPEKKAQLIQLAQSMFAPSRAEVGCISYNFYEDTAHEHHFLFFEEWEEKAAIDRHFETLHFQEFRQKFSQMIVGAPTIKIYKVEEIEQL